MLIFDEFNKALRLFSTSLQKLQSQLRLTLGSERGSPTPLLIFCWNVNLGE